jgi:hypothetical protein
MRPVSKLRHLSSGGFYRFYWRRFLVDRLVDWLYEEWQEECQDDRNGRTEEGFTGIFEDEVGDFLLAAVAKPKRDADLPSGQQTEENPGGTHGHFLGPRDVHPHRCKQLGNIIDLEKEQH